MGACELRVATTSLRRSPGFTLIAIVTLGLGIGANTSMFSVLNGYMLRPAPYPDRHSLERIYRNSRQTPRGGISPADYLDLKSEIHPYGDVAGYAGSHMSVSDTGKPAEMALGLRISANLFPVLGTLPHHGRSFRPGEEIRGNHRVLIISHRYWQERFGGDAGILGHAVRVDGEPYEIVGVLPANFSDWRHLGSFDVFRPLLLDEHESRDRVSTWIRLVGRRRPDLSRVQGDAVISGFGRRLARDFPAVHAESTWSTVPIDDSFLPDYAKGVVAMLVGLSGLVLLIACSNLANLLLARTIARVREFAVRAALGASRSQVVRPLAVECLLLAFAGGLCAILVALWTFDWMAVASKDDDGVGVDFGLDWVVLAWAFGACLFTAFAFGVVPALFVRRIDLNATLKSGGRGTIGNGGHRRFRQVLIAGQFALAMILLAGAALFIAGLHDLNGRGYGWQSDGLVTGTVVLPAATYPGDQEIADFQRLVVERLETLPGVASASVAYSMPFFRPSEPRRFLIAAREAHEPGREPVAIVNGVSPRYFDTVGTRLLSGRVFDDRDSLTAPRVLIVNEAMVRGVFGNTSPLGRRIAYAGREPPEWGEIVGVAADVRSVSADPSPVSYQIYQPIAQEPRRSTEIAVRSSGPAPSALVDGIRTTIMALDRDLPVRRLRAADTAIARANYDKRVVGSILTSLAVLGLCLAALGVYGVIARTVAQRTREFGLRLALGAQVADITRLVLTSGTKLALVGCALGFAGAFGVSRAFAAAFPGMHMSSTPAVLGATVLLLVVAQIACYLPARYASRTDPTEALRAE